MKHSGTDYPGRGVIAIVGAEHGSEGKGVIASRLARGMDWMGAVRVGGPNAGHSFYEGGKLYKMRSVPCAWVRPNTTLVIGAGAVLNADLLEQELEEVDREVVIDHRATLITHEQEQAEAGIKESIGSTGEGVGYARIAKIKRDGSAALAGNHPWKTSRVEVVEDASVVIDMLASNGRVMLEGTQGSALSLHHGDYPYVTSSDTNASGMAAEAGIAPSMVKHVFLVARTYPIRVGGNSGPMAHEVGWDRFVAEGIVAEPERTTVTRKIRRIGEWDPEIYENAVRLNKPCGLFLTFGDYVDPTLSGLGRSHGWAAVEQSALMCEFMDKVLESAYVPILGVGTGGDGWQVAQRLDARCSHGTSWYLD